MYEAPTAEFRGQFRVGRIDSVDKDAHRAKVVFAEQDGFTSWDLQVLVPVSGDYALPAQNTPVLCLIVDGRIGVGYVLGSFYTDNDAAPLSDASQRSIVGSDLRLGKADASDKLALAPKCKANVDALWAVLSNVCGDASSPIDEPGMGAPSALQAAFKIAIAAQEASMALPPVDPACGSVSADDPDDDS